jgi:hypothetical protein
MISGIDKCDIYLDDQDRRRFLFTSRIQPQNRDLMLGVCLMSNHFHPLYKGGHLWQRKD